MASDPRLLSFVENAVRNGAKAEEISATLAEAGWDANEIKTAVESFSGVKFNTPVPRKRSSLFARDFAFYLFLFATLYAAIFGTINLTFNILDYSLPYAGEDRFARLADSIRFWAAYSVVFVPVYMAMAWLAERRRKDDPTCPLSTSRQWLTYLTLLLAGLTALGDIVALIDGYLSGEASLRFYLKVVIVGCVAGAVLLFYLRDIRDFEAEQNEK